MNSIPTLTETESFGFSREVPHQAEPRCKIPTLVDKTTTGDDAFTTPTKQDATNNMSQQQQKKHHPAVSVGQPRDKRWGRRLRARRSINYVEVDENVSLASGGCQEEEEEAAGGDAYELSTATISNNKGDAGDRRGPRQR